MSSNGAELVVLSNAQRELERPMSASEIQAGVNLIQQVMRAVMKEGVHYGTIPGTPKPTLYKAGAEKICSTFRIAVEPVADDLSTVDESRYRVVARATSQATGVYLGSGVGECSSNEAKYRWRAPVCEQEFDETPEDRRRKLWKRGRDGAYQQKQIRTEPADVANTILKMATKRAMIAATLQVTAASDIFSQDIEDLPEELQREIAQDDGGIVAGDAATSHFSEPRPAAPTPAGPGIRVEAVRVAKQGTTREGKAWTLYVVKLSDGQEYKTFDEGLAKLAKAAQAKGAAVSFSYDDTQDKGRKLTNLEEVR